MTIAPPGILVEIKTAQELGFPQGIQNSHLAHLAKTIAGNVQKLPGNDGSSEKKGRREGVKLLLLLLRLLQL